MIKLNTIRTETQQYIKGKTDLEGQRFTDFNVKM